MKTHLAAPSREFSRSEFALVIALAFGLAIVGSLAQALSYSGREIVFGDFELLSTVIYELLFGSAIFVVLRSRGWKWADFAVHASKGSTILGVMLAVAVLLAWLAIEAVIGKVPNIVNGSLASIILVSIVNPIFEEILVLGYVVQAMRKRFGLTTAVNVSLAIRLAYHLYQGPLAVIPVALFGVLVTVVYIRMGRLWPAIVAHGIADFVTLADLV